MLTLYIVFLLELFTFNVFTRQFPSGCLHDLQ